MPKIPDKAKKGKSPLERALDRRRTDSIDIGSPLPSHTNPLFAWAVSQHVAGNPVALNGELEQFSKEERRLLTRIGKQPDESPSLIEEFQAAMTDSEREAFAEILAAAGRKRQPGSPIGKL